MTYWSRKMTYKEALAYPAKNGKGWAHEKDGSLSMQAVTSQSLGMKFCLRPEAVYNWAVRQSIDLQKSLKTFFDNTDLLLVCVLNDWTIKKGQTELLVANPE